MSTPLVNLILLASTVSVVSAKSAIDRLPYPVDAKLDFKSAPIAGAGDAVGSGLALTRVELDSAPGGREERSRIDLAASSLEDVLRGALHELPRRSLTLKPRTGAAPRITIDILSRSGISPARRGGDGVGLQHFAIDRLGIELRASAAAGRRPPPPRALVLIDARRVAIVAGRMAPEIDLRLSEAQRDEFVRSLAELADGELMHREPRFFVHLLDLDLNEYGTIPLASALGTDLWRRAATPSTASPIGQPHRPRRPPCDAALAVG